MKIAIVVPWVPRIMGISLACALSRALSELGETVEFIVHSININVENELRDISTEKVKLTILRRVSNGKISSFVYFEKQYFSRMAHEIVEFFASSEDRYDIIMLISNESKDLGKLLNKKMKNNFGAKPITILLTQELIDYTFTMDKAGLPNYIRKLLSLWKPLFRRVEMNRMRGFDLIYSNSNWTSKNLRNLYGIESRLSLALYDDKKFKMEDINSKVDQIVAPTASLDKHGSELLIRLHNDGIPLVTYGPKYVEGVKYLGFLTAAKMRKLISISKATFFYFDYEALGLIPFESLSLGTPVITIPKQGPYEELGNNKFVYFFSDYDSLLKSCRYLIASTQDATYRQTCSDSINAFRSKKVAEKFLDDVCGYLRGERN